MSDPVTETTVELQGRTVRHLSAGHGPRLLLALHTGAPGRSPFAGSSDLFADLIGRLDLDGLRVLAPDLPGAGGTDLTGPADLTTAGIVAFAQALIAAEQQDITELHVLGHGDASLAALQLTREGAGDHAVASCFLIAPNAAAPIGDSIQNVSLLHPPPPRWSRRSQRWAVDRLTYVPDRFPAALLDRLVANAERAPHAAATALLADPVKAAALLGAQIDAQDAFYAHCRDVGYAQPVTVFWGAGDPTATVTRGTVLASILAGGPAELDFQLVNQCGHFAQFDRPAQLAGVLQTALHRAAGHLIPTT
ncbi:MAG TPA: alpha/beta fold hydrolase [Baekduia sp.]|jgi:pimeloyl-ACP methyl ester carboxylesterase